MSVPTRNINDEMDELNRTAQDSIRIAHEALKALSSLKKSKHSGVSVSQRETTQRESTQREAIYPLDIFGSDVAYWIRVSFAHK
jgi:hypothetical protein